MGRAARHLFAIVSVVSLMLCAAAPWFAVPEKSSTTESFVAASPEAFAEELPSDTLRVGLSHGRPGHYMIERSSSSYGQLVLESPFGHVPLFAATVALLLLPGA